MNQMMRYHPCRYQRQRPYAKQLTSFWSSQVGASTMLTEAAMNGLARLVMNGYNESLNFIPLPERKGRIALNFQEEINTATRYAIFGALGRNIFDFDPTLISMFEKTDVGDIPANVINAPFDSLYLSFGALPHLKLKDGFSVDGAYVFLQKFPDRHLINITLTTRPDDRTDEFSPGDYLLKEDVSYQLDFDLQQDRPLDEVIAEAILEKEKGMEVPEGYDEAFTKAREEALEYGVDVVSVREDSSRRNIDFLYSGFSAFRQAINLVVNGLLYLTAYPEEPTVGWSDDAPTKLAEKADKAATIKERRRAESKLMPLGYSRIRFCRHETTPPGADLGGTTNKVFWRRGHWRNQPYGKGRMLRKLRWIMPVLINSDKGEVPDELGRVYRVQDSDL